MARMAAHGCRRPPVPDSYTLARMTSRRSPCLDGSMPGPGFAADRRYHPEEDFLKKLLLLGLA